LIIIIRIITIIIILVELIKRNITATRAVSVQFTTYHYPDRPVHSRANFNPPWGHTRELLVSTATYRQPTVLLLSSRPVPMINTAGWQRK